LVAVSLATLGVVTVVYGGSTSSEIDKQSSDTASTDAMVAIIKPSAPLVGDLLTLVASVGYGLYQVLYKKYAALPSDPEVASEGLYEQIPVSDSTSDVLYESSNTIDVADAVYPPPFGFHPNMLTSAIGFCTFIVLWIPIPILHYLDIEPFLFPHNAGIILSIAGIALSGVIFNAGFMVSVPIVVVIRASFNYTDPSWGLGTHNYVCWKPTHNRPGSLLRRLVRCRCRDSNCVELSWFWCYYCSLWCISL